MEWKDGREEEMKEKERSEKKVGKQGVSSIMFLSHKSKCGSDL